MADFTKETIREVGDMLQDELHPTFNSEKRSWTLVVPGVSRTDPQDSTKYHTETCHSRQMSMLVRCYLEDRGVIARTAEIREVLSYLKDAFHKRWCLETMTIAGRRRRQCDADERCEQERCPQI